MAPAATAAIEALLQALGGRPGASAAELADGAGIGRSVANKLLVKLAAEGRVARKAGGRRDGRRRPDRWTLLAPAPTQLAKDPDLPPTTPHPSIPDGAAVGSSAPPARRLGAGELRRLVLAYLTDRPQQALSPTAIATALDRSAGPSPTPWRSWPVRAPSPRPRLPPAATTTAPYQPMTGPLHPTGGPAWPGPAALSTRRRRAMPNQGPGGQPPPADQAQELLAMVAHELRRPLTAVRGALATVRHRGHALPASQQQELLGIAHRQAEQMQRLVDQLLVAAALERPRPSPTRWPLVDASPLAEEADRAARLAHPGQQITIEAAGPLLVSADSTAISRILGNLLDNATSHSPPAAPIRLTVARDGQQAVLAVLDHGSGVPSEQCQRIFERYARLEEPAGFAAGGLGLGLYIAWRLARTNRGELSATDPPDGRGARFELRLPLAPHPPHERPAAAGS